MIEQKDAELEASRQKSCQWEDLANSYGEQLENATQGTAENEDTTQDPHMRAAVLEQVKILYRDIKFINSKKQENKFFDLVMDNMGDENLVHEVGDTAANRSEIEGNRRAFWAKYQKMAIAYINEHRNYVQVSWDAVVDFDLHLKILTSHLPFSSICHKGPGKGKDF
jgi:hypothetical protein